MARDVPYDIFVSHVTTDRNFTDELVDKLKKVGFKPFYADSGCIPLASNWQNVLKEATNLKTLKAGIVVVDSAEGFLNSNYAVQEVLELAKLKRTGQLQLYPVLLCYGAAVSQRRTRR